MNTTKQQCSTCSWYNKESGVCGNEELNNLKYTYSNGTDNFKDYWNKMDNLNYVGSAFRCELYLVV
jgi:hypothetical protein